MSKVCNVSNKKPMSGHNVSHANNKTKRRFLPNLQVTSFYSRILDKSFKLKLSANAIKTIDFKGGIDAWLLTSKNKNLDTSFRKIKKLIEKNQTSE